MLTTGAGKRLMCDRTSHQHSESARSVLGKNMAQPAETPSERCLSSHNRRSTVLLTMTCQTTPTTSLARLAPTSACAVKVVNHLQQERHFRGWDKYLCTIRLLHSKILLYTEAGFVFIYQAFTLDDPATRITCTRYMKIQEQYSPCNETALTPSRYENSRWIALRPGTSGM